MIRLLFDFSIRGMKMTWLMVCLSFFVADGIPSPQLVLHNTTSNPKKNYDIEATACSFFNEVITA